jgi:oligopeptide/dipeptide ABC transporter, ATP-binding protein, C-terminal domain
VKELLRINDLSVRYWSEDGPVHALNHVSLSLKEGVSLGLVGETGAGKTTLAKGIMRFIPENQGEVTGEVIYDGENLSDCSDKRMREIRGRYISMIFQDPMTSLNPVMTVGDQIAEVIATHNRVTRAEALDKAREMLEMVGIPGDRENEYPHQFSGGMKQRVVIAIALACRPQILIADEPTTALDVTIQAQVLELIENLRRELHTSVLLITHDLGVVAQNCEEVAIIYAGEIIEKGDVYDVFAKHLHPYTTGLLTAIPSLNVDVKRLNIIEGNIPNPTRLPEGCYFHPRCKHCMDRCRTEKPPVVKVSEEHEVRCWLYQNGGKYDG